MKLQELYTKIINLTDLTPRKEVNDAFSLLVNKAISLELKEKLSFSQINKIQELSSKAEYELEKYWCQKIITSEVSESEIDQFPYIKNYHELTRLEWYSLKGCTRHKKHNVVFAGGGPLPMTAIVLAQDFNISSTVIEINKEAVLLSQKLIRALNLSDKINIIKADAKEFNYSPFNVVFIAALAGLDPHDKSKIFQRIKQTTKRNTHLIARTSAGNRKMLYRPLPKNLFKMFKPILQVNPYNEIVNSIIIFQNV